jgi:hypothetical protein
MIFHDAVSTEYRAAVHTAVDTIIERGNETHRRTVKSLARGDVEIRVVPLKKINVSGVTGLISRWRANRRINDEPMSFTESLGEVHITFSDWTFDVGGQRGVEGTLVHEGLHACDFAEIISSFSRAETDPLDIFDLSLYELERRAAVASAEYLSRIGKEDYVNEGMQLGLVGIDSDGRPFVDIEGIESRMQNGYRVNASDQGVMISRLLGIRPKGTGGLLAFLGF